MDNYSIDGVKTLWWALKCEIRVFLEVVRYCICENLSNFRIFEVIWGSYFAIMGYGLVEIREFWLCGG